MQTLKILILCLVTTIGFAQKQMTKTAQSIKVNKDVTVDLSTSHVEIQIDTWNKDIVEVEAYLESNKLSEEELELALKAWNLKVEGANDYVKISSDGSKSMSLFGDSNYSDLLQNLEFELADFPEISEIIVLPDMPNMDQLFPNGAMPELPEMPKMPELPELPDLPDGVKTITFDYDKYIEEGETYLTEWSKRYEKEGGKELQERMEAWARKFADSDYQEKMQAWGEEYGKRFEGKWAKDMEKWGEKFGEKFGRDMEKWGEEFGEKFGKEWEEKMEKWGERYEKQMESRVEAMEKREKIIEERMKERSEREKERAKALVKRKQEMEKRKSSILARRLESSGNSKVKKVIKIKIPKKAKLKTNIRHGELKISSVIHNFQGDISHSFLVAEHIDGRDTSINVSYSPVVINTWNLGTLNLNFVDKVQIKTAKDLVLNSKSSNINIEAITDTAIIDGSFGDLTISKLSSSFKNLNLVLEHSDALVNLPNGIDYNMYFKGNRSKYNNKPTTQKTVREDGNGQNTNRTIIINAKFSNVIVN